jgi:hypothetical protein
MDGMRLLIKVAMDSMIARTANGRAKSCRLDGPEARQYGSSNQDGLVDAHQLQRTLRHARFTIGITKETSDRLQG